MWRDRTVFQADTSAVAQVVIERDGSSYTVERGDSTWTLDGEPANRMAIMNLTQELNHFLASGFLEEIEPSEANPKRVTALDASGDTLATVLITGNEAGLQARIPSNDVVFLVSDYQVRRIAPELVTLRPEANPDS
jgi:hypothetical protein